jgi:hypothetical protein
MVLYMPRVANTHINTENAVLQIQELKQLNAIAMLMGMNKVFNSQYDKTLYAALQKSVLARSSELGSVANIVDIQSKEHSILQFKEQYTLGKEHVERFIQHLLQKPELNPVVSQVIGGSLAYYFTTLIEHSHRTKIQEDRASETFINPASHIMEILKSIIKDGPLMNMLEKQKNTSARTR